MKWLIQWVVFETWLGVATLGLLERVAGVAVVEAGQIADQVACSTVLGLTPVPARFVPDNLGVVVSAPRNDPCFSDALHNSAEFYEAES